MPEHDASLGTRLSRHTAFDALPLPERARAHHRWRATQHSPLARRLLCRAVRVHRRSPASDQRWCDAAGHETRPRSPLCVRGHRGGVDPGIASTLKPCGERCKPRAVATPGPGAGSATHQKAQDWSPRKWATWRRRGFEDEMTASRSSHRRLGGNRAEPPRVQAGAAVVGGMNGRSGQGMRAAFRTARRVANASVAPRGVHALRVVEHPTSRVEDAALTA
jgi:hypothetical protein